MAAKTKSKSQRPQQRTSQRHANRQGLNNAPALISRSRYAGYAFWTALSLGVILRLLTFAYIGYFNNDNHLSVIEYVSRHWQAPNAAQFNQAYHPPLYYFLAAPFFLLGNLPAVQTLSLILSIATLAIVAIWLRGLPWISERSKSWCLALAATHPQFVLFSLFISNDTLTIFLGALIFYQSWRLLNTPSQSNCVGLSVLLGLGLLTKAVFLVFVLPLLILVWFTGHGLNLPRSQKLSRIVGFVFIALIVGSYKYMENLILFGNPLISNLDLSNWAAEQKPTWIGLWSLFDINLLKLVREPIISVATVHSYPLMIYGSFWYALVPESTFLSNLIPPFNRLGSLIHLVALIPTVLMLIGAGRAGMTLFRLCSESPEEKHSAVETRTVYEGVCLIILLLNLLLILFVGWRSDVWSVFQGRLLFPSYCAALLVLNGGMERVTGSTLLNSIVQSSLSVLMGLFLAYFLIEFWLAGIYPTNPLSTEHMPFTIDMKHGK